MSNATAFVQVAQIAKRAHEAALIVTAENMNGNREFAGAIVPDVFSLIMYIDTAREHCPLDLAGLLDATDGDLIHDVFGIVQHLDKQTGKLNHGFCPRYAIRQ